MSGDGKYERRGRAETADGAHDPADGPGGTGCSLAGPVSRPRLRVRVIERVAIIRFSGSEILLEEGAVGGVIGQLEDLIAGERHARLVLNFGGVRYVSSP